MILQPVYYEGEFSSAGIKSSAIVSGPRTAEVRYVMHIAVQSTALLALRDPDCGTHSTAYKRRSSFSLV